jgi:hypothetical protein
MTIRTPSLTCSITSTLHGIAWTGPSKLVMVPQELMRTKGEQTEVSASIQKPIEDKFSKLKAHVMLYCYADKYNIVTLKESAQSCFIHESQSNRCSVNICL